MFTLGQAFLVRYIITSMPYQQKSYEGLAMIAIVYFGRAVSTLTLRSAYICAEDSDKRR